MLFRSIQEIAEFVKEKVQGIDFDYVSNERHDTFFFYIKKKKQDLNEEPEAELPQEEMPNEGA